MIGEKPSTQLYPDIIDTFGPQDLSGSLGSGYPPGGRDFRIPGIGRLNLDLGKNAQDQRRRYHNDVERIKNHSSPL
jgi:hypothetical protein